MNQPPGSFPIGDCVGIVVCLVLSALFSGSETTLTALPEPKARQIMESRRFGAQVLKIWLDRPGRILSTLLVGNNLVNIAASVLGASVAFWVLSGVGGRNWADAAAVVLMTFLLLVFSEVSPKVFAKHNAERLAVGVGWFVRIVEIPLFPIAFVVSRLGKVVLRVVAKLFGGRTAASGTSVTEKDIEYMIELGAREGVFEKREMGTLLEAVVDFSDTLVKEVMIPRTDAVTLPVNARVREALDMIVDSAHSRVPVYKESIDEVVGVLYAKDLLYEVATHGCSADKSIEPFVRTPVFFVPETRKVVDCLKDMQRLHNHLGVVVDEFGGVSGIVTLEDILEELVGEIQDEHDAEEDPIRKVDEHTFVIDAKTSIYDVGEALGVNFPDNGEYETVGGFVVSRMGRVPEVGSVIEWDGLDIEVLDADDRHVAQVRIVRRAAAPSAESPPEASA